MFIAQICMLFENILLTERLHISTFQGTYALKYLVCNFTFIGPFAGNLKMSKRQEYAMNY